MLNESRERLTTRRAVLRQMSALVTATAMPSLPVAAQVRAFLNGESTPRPTGR